MNTCDRQIKKDQWSKIKDAAPFFLPLKIDN